MYAYTDAPTYFNLCYCNNTPCIIITDCMLLYPSRSKQYTTCAYSHNADCPNFTYVSLSLYTHMHAHADSCTHKVLLRTYSLPYQLLLKPQVFSLWQIWKQTAMQLVNRSKDKTAVYGSILLCICWLNRRWSQHDCQQKDFCSPPAWRHTNTSVHGSITI